MQTGRNDPCPCGSGKKFKKCCLSSTYTVTGREDSIRSKLVQDLMKFFNKNYRHTLDDAHRLFWADFNLKKHLDETCFDIASQNFFEWIVHDFVVDEERNKTLIDLYLESSRRSSADEHRVLSMMKNSIISLYEVQEVFPEKGLLLKDLLLGDEYDVKEKLATRSLSKWDIYATRLLYIDGKYIMSGSVYPYPLNQKESMLEDIHAEYEQYRAEHPEAAIDDFLKRASGIFNFYWYNLIQNPKLPVLQTTSGETMMISNALFEIRDKDAVIEGLAKIKGFEKEGHEFLWFSARGNEGRATLLGRIEIKKNCLMLECHSKKRLEKGKSILIKALSRSIKHKIDTFQNPMESVKDYKRIHVKSPTMKYRWKYNKNFIQNLWISITKNG